MAGGTPHRSNPNFLPVSPKRGFAEASRSQAKGLNLSSAQTDPSSVNAISTSLQQFTTASSYPPPSPSKWEGRTRAARPAKLAPLPSAAEIRRKRDWTVVRRLGKEKKGGIVTVEWKDTVVPHRSIKLDKASGRPYVKADHMKHWIAEKRAIGCDNAGQPLWKCVWVPSDVPKAMTRNLPVEEVPRERDTSDSSSDSEADLDTPAATDSESDTSSDSGSESEADPETPGATDSESDTPSMPSQPRTPSPPSTSLLQSSGPDCSSSTPRDSIESSEQRSPAGHRSSTVSSIDFDLLPEEKPDRLQFAVKSDTANYGPAVRALIADSMGKKLVTTTNKAPGHLQRRLDRRLKRPLQFRSWTVGRRGHRINVQDRQNAEAVLAHMQGHDVIIPCNNCERGHGNMQGCVVDDDLGMGKDKGECTNCHYGGKSRRCCFRKDTTDEGGYRAPIVIRLPPKDVSPAQKSSTANGGTVSRPQGKLITPNPEATLNEHGEPLFPTPRDFVHDGVASSSSPGDSDEIVMSGGLSESTISPVPKPAQTHASRVRTHSLSSSDGDDVPLTKRPRIAQAIETIDLTSSPEKARSRKKKGRRSLFKDRTRAPAQTERCHSLRSGFWTPPSSPPALLAMNKAPTREKRSLVDANRPALATLDVNTCHALPPQQKNSGQTSVTTSSVAQLQKRKEQRIGNGIDFSPTNTWVHTERHSAPNLSNDGPARFTQNESARRNATSRNNPTAERRNSGAAATVDVSFKSPPKAKSVADKQPTAGSSTALPKHTTASGRASSPGISASEGSSKRKATQQQHRTADRASHWPPNSLSNSAQDTVAGTSTTSAATKPAKELSRKKERRSGGAETTEKSTSNKSDDRRQTTSGERAPGNEPACAPSTAKTQTHPQRPTHEPAPQEHPRTMVENVARSPPTVRSGCACGIHDMALPDPSTQSPVHAGTRFGTGELTAAHFSWIWQRSDAETQRGLVRLMKWARYERRVARDVSLAGFFSQADEEREWLNTVVIPQVCPPGRVMVVSLDGDSDSSDEELEKWEKDAMELRYVMDVPEDGDEGSEWMGSSDDDEESSTDEEGCEDDGSGDEEEDRESDSEEDSDGD